MDEAQTAKQEPEIGYLTDPPDVPLMQQAAEIVAGRAEAMGLKAIPLYFAANVVSMGGGLHAFGRLRFDYAKAIEDGKAEGLAVSFVVQIARPDSDDEMAWHDACLKQRDSGLEFGHSPKGLN